MLVNQLWGQPRIPFSILSQVYHQNSSMHVGVVYNEENRGDGSQINRKTEEEG